MKKISYILIILFFLLSLENILAQEMNHSPAAIEKMKLDQLWHKRTMPPEFSSMVQKTTPH